MNLEERDTRWQRLAMLLQPIHGQALATARRLCGRADGDDLYQEAVLRAFEKLHTLRDESHFRSWFYVTLLSRHRSRHRLRFWRRLIPWDQAFPEEQDPVGKDGSSWYEDAWRAKRIALGLSALRAEQREAIVLFEMEGFSIEEIAVMQRTSISAVKSRLSRGRERLRSLYQRHGWLAGGDETENPSPTRKSREPEAAARDTPSRTSLAAMVTVRLQGEERSHE